MQYNLDDELVAYLNDHLIDEFDGIWLGEYDEIEESLEENLGNPSANLIKYMLELTRCPADELNTLIEAGTGKYVDEIMLSN